MTAPPPLMVEARRVLLDALAEHRDPLVLVGAQAVYLRTDEITLSFSASYTTDADLAIDPTTLAQTPPLGHSRIRVTMDVYGHLHGDSKDEIAECPETNRRTGTVR